MNIIDLSHCLSNSTTVYPGTPAIDIRPIATANEHGYTEHSMAITTHTGTHIDAPAHVASHAIAIDTMPLECFYGKAMVIDCRNTGNKLQIGVDSIIANRKKIEKVDFVIFHTGWDKYWQTDNYTSEYPVLTDEAAQILATMRLKGVGIDTISIDSASNENLTNHHHLLSNNIIIIENLTNLNMVLGINFTFACFPLKIIQGDGSPVRAVAILPPQKTSIEKEIKH